MQTVQQSKAHWSLRDVIFLAIIAIFFGIIYQLWSYMYYVLAATPLKPFANDATIGVWLMAGPMAGVVLKKIGATFLGEILASVVEMLLFSSWGVSTLLAGAIQGLGSELGFTFTGYKNWGKTGLALSVVTSTIVTFAWDLFSNGYLHYNFMMLVGLFSVRLISIGFFAGVLVDWIKRLLDRTGLLK
ncbi:energy-coupling factor transport system substrate-specific component [Weissella uvarum]|uniref:ECF transporter S component n=1 Tax=Weissella uvarum TaxID=1479233 RepID=UPI001961914C|nr:ECF transporter S component [Weissella uvarum]MBM7617159.1 energy-coupling factor transport system substrate-specific component [Weissella uvarum]MCM0595455.1 ECF transporter S component [Weissella uvarum]